MHLTPPSLIIDRHLNLRAEADSFNKARSKCQHRTTAVFGLNQTLNLTSEKQVCQPWELREAVLNKDLTNVSRKPKRGESVKAGTPNWRQWGGENGCRSVPGCGEGAGGNLEMVTVTSLDTKSARDRRAELYPNFFLRFRFSLKS